MGVCVQAVLGRERARAGSSSAQSRRSNSRRKEVLCVGSIWRAGCVPRLESALATGSGSLAASATSSARGMCERERLGARAPRSMHCARQ